MPEENAKTSVEFTEVECEASEFYVELVGILGDDIYKSSDLAWLVKEREKCFIFSREVRFEIAWVEEKSCFVYGPYYSLTRREISPVGADIFAEIIMPACVVLSPKLKGFSGILHSSSEYLVVNIEICEESSDISCGCGSEVTVPLSLIHI